LDVWVVLSAQSCKHRISAWAVLYLLPLCCCQGYGDLHAYSVAEAAYVVVFMFVSLGVTAYFVGTSVLLVVENEKKTGGHRSYRQLV
jgi:hypothetical protein